MNREWDGIPPNPKKNGRHWLYSESDEQYKLGIWCASFGWWEGDFAPGTRPNDVKSMVYVGECYTSEDMGKIVKKVTDLVSLELASITDDMLKFVATWVANNCNDDQCKRAANEFQPRIDYFSHRVRDIMRKLVKAPVRVSSKLMREDIHERVTFDIRANACGGPLRAMASGLAALSQSVPQGGSLSAVLVIYANEAAMAADAKGEPPI